MFTCERSRREVCSFAAAMSEPALREPALPLALLPGVHPRPRSDSCESSDSSLPSLSGTSFSGTSLSGTMSSALYTPERFCGRVSFGTLPAASPRTSLDVRDSTRAWWEVFGDDYDASWRASNATLSNEPIDAQPARVEAVGTEAEDDSGARHPAPPVVRERQRTLVEAFLDLFSKREDEPYEDGGASKRSSGCDVQGVVRVPVEALLDSDGRK